MKQLRPQEKILLSHIVSLAKEKGYCYATNKHFKVIDPYFSERNVERILKHLSEQRVIRIEREPSFRMIFPIVGIPVNSVGIPDILTEQPTNLTGNPSELTPIESKENKERTKTVSTPVAPASNTKPKPAFNFITSKWDYVTDEMVKLWETAYPACDIEIELRKMAAWLLANPKKRKTQYSRFIVNWLSNTQNRGGTK